MRIARPAQALFEIVAVEARLGHLVGAQLLARDMRRAGGADAAAQAVLGAVVVGPALHPVRILGDVGHQVPEFARRVRGEQIRRQPEHVEMTICRDTLVLPGHQLSSLTIKECSAGAKPPLPVTLSQVFALILAAIAPGWHAAIVNTVQPNGLWPSDFSHGSTPAGEVGRALCQE